MDTGDPMSKAISIKKTNSMTASAGASIAGHPSWRDLDEFLKAHQCKKDAKDEKGNEQKPTHTRIGGTDVYGGSFYIPDSEYETFMQLYFNAVIKNGKPEYLTEKQLPTGECIAIDLDLHFAYDTEERVYTDDEVGDLIHWYLEELKTIFQFDEDTHIPVFLFEKSQVNRVKDKQITKDGLHLIIGIKMDHTAQCILRNRMIERIKQEWNDIPIINVNGWEDVFDKGISAGYTNWQLYGSKKPHHEAYKLSKVWDYTYDPTDGEMSANAIAVATFLTAENFPKLSVRYQGNTQFFYKSGFSQTLAQQASGGHAPGRRTPGLSESTSFEDFSIMNEHANLQMVSSIRTAEDLESAVNRFLDTISPKEYILRELYEYVMILPETYYGSGSYNKWIRVGWALKNVSERLLVVWLRFSARASGFQYSSISDLCLKWSNEFLKKRDGLTERSIMYWAMQDNHEGFKQVKQNTVSNLLDQTINTISMNTLNQPGKGKGSGEYDIARVLFEIYKFEYKCISVKNNIWYRFKNHRWIEIDSGTTLRRAISDVLRDLYMDKANQVFNLMGAIDTDGPEAEQKKILEKRATTIINICDKLGKTNDKKNIMIEARDLFYDPEFMQRIDNNPMLLCFSNGVYDFEEKVFRKGLPEDYITKCTNCEYFPLTSSKHAGVADKIKVFMEQLFPRPELCRYMWDHLASTLLGKASVNQTFNMYIGEGQNGKSVLTDLMGKTLGDYKVGVPITLLTGARGKIGGLAPEVVAMKGARYAVIQEPDSNERINVGVMKELVSGVEPIKARAPYMLEPVEFVPQFKLILCSNEFMEIKSRDHGTWRRIRVVPFESLFTDNPVKDDPDKPFQFKVDRELLNQFDVWKQTFAAMLVDRVLITGGRVEDCDIVLSASNSYKERQDYMAQFVSERVCRQPGDSLKKAHLSEEFKIWYQTNFGTKPPSTKDLHEYMDKTFGKNRAGVWANIRIKYDDPSGNSLPSTMMEQLGPMDDMGEIVFE